MALSLPWHWSGMQTISRAGSRIDTPKKTLRTRASCIALPEPRIVLARGPRPVLAAAPVALGEPALRPEAVRAQIEATRSLLLSLADTRAALEAGAGAAEAHGRDAGSETERVTAMMETYRVKNRLDDALRGAFRDISALMEERGLR